AKVFREKRSARGHPYWVLEDEHIPRIGESFLDCVLYLYRSKSDAEQGVIHTSELLRGGSGFLIGIPSTTMDNRFYVYAVSNRHVVTKNPFIRLNTKDGRTDVLEVQPT